MRRAIAGPLGRFNETQTGQLEDYRPLAILVSHPDTAEILGGLWGETVCRQNLMDKLTKELRESGPSGLKLRRSRDGAAAVLTQ
jgi:hypothetical protein